MIVSVSTLFKRRAFAEDERGRSGALTRSAGRPVCSVPERSMQVGTVGRVAHVSAAAARSAVTIRIAGIIRRGT